MTKRKVATMPAKSVAKINLGEHALAKPIKAKHNGNDVLVVARDHKLGTSVIKIGERIAVVRTETLSK